VAFVSFGEKEKRKTTKLLVIYRPANIGYKLNQTITVTPFVVRTRPQL